MIKLGVACHIDGYNEIPMIGDTYNEVKSGKHKEIHITDDYVIDRLRFNIDDIDTLDVKTPYGTVGLRVHNTYNIVKGSNIVSFNVQIGCNYEASKWIDENRKEIKEHFRIDNGIIEVW